MSGEQRRALFGRAKGKKLRSHQSDLMRDLRPRLEADLGALREGRLFAPGRELWLEIGFGGGEHLVAQAAANRSVGYIGTDAFLNGVAKALVAIDEHRLDNVRLFSGDASELIDWLPGASLARIDLLYPDPWPKRRHWKRRFVQDDNLKRLARLLKSGGEFRFATDIPGYAEYVLMRILRSGDFVWTARRAADWREPWQGFVRTRYETKAIREGRTPAYFIFRRV